MIIHAVASSVHLALYIVKTLCDILQQRREKKASEENVQPDPGGEPPPSKKKPHGEKRKRRVRTASRAQSEALEDPLMAPPPYSVAAEEL